jgi:hypothetical protein
VNISATSLSFAKSAERLINDIVHNFQPSSVSQSSTSSPSSGDVVDFSVSAAAVLNGHAAASVSTGDRSATDNFSGTTQDKYSNALGLAAEAALPEGSSTTFTFNSAGTQPVVSGALAGVINSIDATGKVIAQPGESAAELNFANVYAAQRADGAAVGFYKGTDASFVASTLPSAEGAAFLTAFNNHTLDIQSGSNIAGVTITGNDQATTTFSEGAAGGSEISSSIGTSYEDVSGLEKTNQYVLTTGSLLFGNVVVSWGGPQALSR